MLPVVHHPDYRIGQNGVGSFPWDKYAQVIALLREHVPSFTEHSPDIMSRHWLEAVHAPSYVDQVLRAEVAKDIERRIGFAVSPDLAIRAQRTCGGTWLAGRLALDHGFAANTAGGSHHAMFDSGAGYCIFNDLAVAAHRLLAEGDVDHILIIDLDVHQGDGTAALLAGRSDVTTFSMHAERNFPVRKAQSSIDVGLPDGCDDDAYLDILTRHLPVLIAHSKPDLIFYQAGVDAHIDDKLGRLGLTDTGLIVRDKLVGEFAKVHGIPLASVLGGGYGHDILAVAQRHVTCIRTLAAYF